MQKIVAGLLAVLCIAHFALSVQAQAPTASFALRLATNDGYASFQPPAGWYLAVEEDESGESLIATSNPARAQNWQGGGELLLRLWVTEDSPADLEASLLAMLKLHQVNPSTWTGSAFSLHGVAGWRITGESAQGVRVEALALAHAGRLTHWLAVADSTVWDESLIEKVRASLWLLPESAPTPKGWTASLRAPLGWRADSFSSFARWTAPDEGRFAGTEIWFQAGVRQDLIGQGEPAFVLRSLGVNYTGQVAPEAQSPLSLGGLSATSQPFESFTHVGVSVNAMSGLGAANLIVRAPLNTWTAAHQSLTEAVLASVSIQPPSATTAPVGLRVGYRAPDVTGRFADGTPFRLSDYAGRLVLVHFWFVDCPYCREEWTYLDGLIREYEAEGLVVLAVNALDSQAYIQAYQQAEGYTFPFVLDDGSLHQIYQVTAFPTTFAVAPDGLIVNVARGAMSERSVRNLIGRYLLGD
jgi:peroxiredoxin